MIIPITDANNQIIRFLNSIFFDIEFTMTITAKTPKPIAIYSPLSESCLTKAKIDADNTHINDDSTNYLPENLKWGTPGENMKGVKRHLDTPERKYLNLVEKEL